MQTAFRIILPAVMILDLLLPFFISIPYKGYSHRDMALSVLGNRKSPLHMIYNLWQIVSGVVFVWAGYTAYTAFHNTYPALGIALMLCLAAYGIGCEIVSALFPVGESKQAVTIAATIHGIFSVLGFMTLLAAPLLLGIMQMGMAQQQKGVVSIVFFILALFGMVFFVMSDKPELKDKWFAHEGLWQRVCIGLLYFPLLLGLL